MELSKHSFIFIPDISGFSGFVNNTEISHSQHIISELIELIISSNTLGLEVAEVEGDAVLFFREGFIPALDELLEQIEKTYLAFHTHLLQYDKYRICTCGACSTASNLNLKFIAHQGELGFIDVQGRKKPHGKEVIIAHRLLKSGIDISAYALISEPLADYYSPRSEWQKGSKSDTDLGEIGFYFLDLAPLDHKVAPPENFTPPDTTANPIVVDKVFRTDIDMLSEMIANFTFREKWQKGVDKFIFNKNEVNRVGTQHVCVVNNRGMNFETVATERSKDHRAIGERTKNPPLFKELLTYYVMTRNAQEVHLKVEIHYFQKNIISRLMTPFFRLVLRRNLVMNLQSLENFLIEWKQ